MDLTGDHCPAEDEAQLTHKTDVFPVEADDPVAIREGGEGVLRTASGNSVCW